MLKIFQILFRKTPPPPTHVIHLDGVEGFIFRNECEGRKLIVSGWCDHHWKWNDGDLVQLITDITPEGARGGTYRMDRVEHCGDPPDMYFLDATFVGAQR